MVYAHESGINLVFRNMEINLQVDGVQSQCLIENSVK